MRTAAVLLWAFRLASLACLVAAAPSSVSSAVRGLGPSARIIPRDVLDERVEIDDKEGEHTLSQEEHQQPPPNLVAAERKQFMARFYLNETGTNVTTDPVLGGTAARTGANAGGKGKAFQQSVEEAIKKLEEMERVSELRKPDPAEEAQAWKEYAAEQAAAERKPGAHINLESLKSVWEKLLSVFRHPPHPA